MPRPARSFDLYIDTVAGYPSMPPMDGKTRVIGLKADSWNDYTYETLFRVTLYGREKTINSTSLGEMRLLIADTKKNARRTGAV